jgi:hypothetical protein
MVMFFMLFLCCAVRLLNCLSSVVNEVLEKNNVFVMGIQLFLREVNMQNNLESLFTVFAFVSEIIASEIELFHLRNLGRMIRRNRSNIILFWFMWLENLKDVTTSFYKVHVIRLHTPIYSYFSVF